MRAAFSDEIVQTEALFKRIKAVYDTRTRSGLTRGATTSDGGAVHGLRAAGRGARPARQSALTATSTALATLFTTFRQNQAYDEDHSMVVLDSQADLAGLPESLKAAPRRLPMTKVWTANG